MLEHIINAGGRETSGSEGAMARPGSLVHNEGNGGAQTATIECDVSNMFHDTGPRIQKACEKGDWVITDCLIVQRR